MNPIIAINYCCPSCGHTWDDFFKTTALMPACDCPNCEEPVAGTVKD